MLDTCEKVMAEALTEALETMAFMIAAAPEEPMPEPVDSVLVRMNFTGPLHGTTELAASGEFMQMLAANVMGVDPDDPEAHVQGTDAFKELLNTTCGVLLPMLATSPEDVFHVTIPESEEIFGCDRWQHFIDQPGVTVLDVDTYPVALRITLNQ